MSTSFLQCCKLVLLLIYFHGALGCNDDTVTDDLAGSTVKMEVLPKSINELITDEITLTCTPKDLPQGTQDIMFMELGKEGEHPLASLRGSELKLGHDLKDNMEAKGHNSNNSSESYLQLTIKRPFVDDVNVYCCRMFYQNEFGELKMGHVYADVSIEKNDKAVLVHLLKKMSDLENTIKLQDTVISQQKKQMKDRVNEVSQRMDELEGAGRNQSQLIQDIVDKESFSSAFSVYGTKKTFSAGEILIFKNFQLNVGGHYDLVKGIYTAPKDGHYVFNLVLFVADKDDMYVHLKKNGQIVATARPYDSGNYDQTSVSSILSLNEGDKVWPYVDDGSELIQPDGQFTFFNGYLLKQL